MNVLSIALLVASIVAGAFGIVFVVEAVRGREDKRDKKRSIAFSVVSFFASIVMALGSSYVAYASKHKGFTFDNFVWKTPSVPPQVQVDAPMITAMLTGVGVA